MARRDLYIVSTDRTDLYKLLKERLAGREHVEVILDRRRGKPWTASGGREERRHAERRYYDEDHLLRTIGVILVRGERSPSSDTR